MDKTLAQIRFLTPSNEILGVINWFAVHPTSMNNTNKLVSSDNVGYASILMEKALNGNETLPGKVYFYLTNLANLYIYLYYASLYFIKNKFQRLPNRRLSVIT